MKYNLSDPKTYEINNGYYGDYEFGGQYVPELLIPSLEELAECFEKYRSDADFLVELEYYQRNFIGRPSPLIFAKNLTKQIGGAKIYIKNEGANHTGSHKINHCLYQILLAKRMGKTNIICETGAGQHGLACATVCAKFGMRCKVFMGQKDIQKQYPNVFFMKLMGAEVVPVTQGNQILSDAVDMAIGEFLQNPESYYMLGSALGPAPYPEIMREAQKIISVETEKQILEIENKLPNVVIACIGGGSNAIGAFNQYLTKPEVELLGVEAAGKGIANDTKDLSKNQDSQTQVSENQASQQNSDTSPNSPKMGSEHASRLHSGQGKIGIMQGFKSYFLLDENGQNIPTHSIASGLNYAGIGPIHGYLHSIGRLKISSATDQEVLDACRLLAQTEGILGALESCHAVAEGVKQAKSINKEEIVLINLSGRADNYLFNLASGFGDQEFADFCHSFGK